MITRAEAAASLDEADRVDRQTRLMGGYAVAGPHLILWGAVWLIGYVASGLINPLYWAWIWLPLVLAASVCAIVIGQRARARGLRVAAAPMRSLLLSSTIIAFFISVYAVFRPTGVAPYLVFPGLVTALIYTGIGIFGWPRFGLIGIAIFVATLGSYFLAEPWLPFCVGIAGGGGLILGGIWLGKA